jgi:hypothetical protein
MPLNVLEASGLRHRYRQNNGAYYSGFNISACWEGISPVGPPEISSVVAGPLAKCLLAIKLSMVM